MKGLVFSISGAVLVFVSIVLFYSFPTCKDMSPLDICAISLAYYISWAVGIIGLILLIIGVIRIR